LDVERDVSRILGAGLLVLIALAAPARAEMIVGTAEVIDSDVLLLDGYRVYLFGIESLESGQVCAIGGENWECYPAAVRKLQTIVTGGEVTCEIMSGPDFLDQVIGRCTLGGEDIAEQFVRAGFALTIPEETTEYDDEMDAARQEGVGLWQGRFFLPSDWRQYERIFADRPAYVPLQPAP
jgi:endonuclease YncB( thermonuclease family)